MPLDLAQDARRGAPFALPPEAGGTGRDDGGARSVVLQARVRYPGGSVYDGDLVKFGTNGGGPYCDVWRTDSPRESVLGVIVDPTGVGIAHNLIANVMVIGYHPHVKVTGSTGQGQYLVASSTAGAAEPISDPRTPNIFARALSGGTTYTSAFISSEALYVGTMLQLGLRQGVASLADILRGRTNYGSPYSGYASASQDGDDSTSYLSSDHVKVDAEYPFITSGARLRIAVETGGSFTATVWGGNNPDFSTGFVQLGGQLAWSQANGNDVKEPVLYWAPAGPYRYYKFVLPGGFHTIYSATVWEAQGSSLLPVLDPRTGGGALLDDVLEDLIPQTLLASKGDLFAAAANDDVAVLAIAADNADLIADSGSAVGVSWRKCIITNADPTVDDDATLGYRIGSRWINTTSLEEFVCLDATDGSADWISTTDQGAGNLPTGTAKGQIAVYSGSTWQILNVGTDTHVLTADSAATLGVKWDAASSGASVPPVVLASGKLTAHLNWR